MRICCTPAGVIHFIRYMHKDYVGQKVSERAAVGMVNWRTGSMDTAKLAYFALAGWRKTRSTCLYGLIREDVTETNRQLLVT